MMRMSLIAASLALVIAASAAIAQDAQTPSTEAATGSATVTPAPVMPAPAAVAAPVLAPAPATPAALVGDTASGKSLTYTCRGCHGVTGYKNAYPAYKVPKLGGQSQPLMFARGKGRGAALQG